MEKINIKDLNLLVTSKEIKTPNPDWIYKAIELLIKQRVQHCKSELDEAISKSEAYFQNCLESQIIVYKDKSGNFYGHFSVPVYNNMVEFLNHTDSISCYINKGIVQQALRQCFYNCHHESAMDIVLMLLENYGKTKQDLEGALTELLLVMPK